MRSVTPADEASGLLVIDASVLVAIVGSSAATTVGIAARIGNSVLHAPAILPVEVDSALRGLEAGRRLSPVHASAARAQAHRMPIELWPWELLAERAWELRRNLTTYDAGYVALAERLGATLLTGDARLAAAPGSRCEIEVVALG